MRKRTLASDNIKYLYCVCFRVAREGERNDDNENHWTSEIMTFSLVEAKRQDEFTLSQQQIRVYM